MKRSFPPSLPFSPPQPGTRGPLGAISDPSLLPTGKSPTLHGQFGVLNAGFMNIWKCYFLNGTDTEVVDKKPEKS